MSFMSSRMFQPGDRIAFEQLGYFSAGTVRTATYRGYTVEWDDGFVESVSADGTEYTYDGWDLIPLSEVNPDLVRSLR